MFFLDRAVIGPFMTQRTELKGQIAEQETKLRAAKQLLNTSRQMNRRWAEISSGKLTRVQGEAESSVLHSLEDWARDAGLALPSLKPERAEKEKDFIRITWRANVTG